MSGDKQSSEREKEHIKGLRCAGLGIKAIARELQKSHHVILNFFEKSEFLWFQKANKT